MGILEEYKVPQSVLKKQEKAHEKMLPQINKHYEQRKNQKSSPSLNDR